MRFFPWRRRIQPDSKLKWGPWTIPFKERQSNFAFLGTAGSGKTLGFILQYANILPRIVPGGGQRALIYDKKGDVLPILHALQAQGYLHRDIPIILFNPCDSRSYAWDIARDLDTLPSNQLGTPAQRIVANFFPKEPRANASESPFYRKTFLGIAAAVLRGMIASQTPWALRDFMNVLANKEQRERLLALDPLGAKLLGKGSEDVQKDVEATIGADLVPFGDLADLMNLASDAGRTFTIHDWLRQPSILVFTGPPSEEEPLAYLNRTFLTELTQALANRPDTTTDVTWCFFDEAPSIGRLPAFATLLRVCRSKGASSFLGIQDISGFQQAMQDRDLVHSILAQITNLAFFLIPDFDTAKWASERCASTGMVINYSSGRVEPMPRFRPSVFQNQKGFSVANGLPGIFLSRHRRPLRTMIKPLLLKGLTGPGAATPLGHQPWPGDAVPRPNPKLASFLEALCPAVPTRQVASKISRSLPTTGQVDPDS